VDICVAGVGGGGGGEKALCPPGIVMDPSVAAPRNG